MSTRSLICVKRDTNKYEAIYCHSDGYLTYNGAMLLDHYKDIDKIERLIKLGNISSLQKNVEPNPDNPHTFDNRQGDVVVAYMRDRGETNQGSSICTLEELKEWDWIEYIYVFDTGNWYYAEYPFDDFDLVENGLKKEYKNLGFDRPDDYYGYFTSDDIKQLKKGKTTMTLTNEEYNVIEKIAKKSKCDCWFELGTDTYGNDCVIDLEEDKEIDLIDGLLQLDNCLTDLTDYNLTKSEIKYYSKLMDKIRVINTLDRDRLETLLYNAIVLLETDLNGKKLIETELADEINITQDEYNYLMSSDD